MKKISVFIFVTISFFMFGCNTEEEPLDLTCISDNTGCVDFSEKTSSDYGDLDLYNRIDLDQDWVCSNHVCERKVEKGYIRYFPTHDLFLFNVYDFAHLPLGPAIYVEYMPEHRDDFTIFNEVNEINSCSYSETRILTCVLEDEFILTSVSEKLIIIHDLID